MKLFACLLLSGLLAACASVQTPPISEGLKAGDLIVYQPLSSNSDARLPFIFVDGLNQGRIGVGGEVHVRLGKGEHLVALREPLLLWPGVETASTRVTVNTDETTFVRFNRRQIGVQAGGSAVTQPELTEVDGVLGKQRQ